MSLKKTVYLLLTMLLGVLLMSIVHTLLDFWYFYIFAAADTVPVQSTFWLFSTHLPVYVPGLLLIAGLVGGLWTGLKWWQIVYVEKRHWSFQKKTAKKHSRKNK